MNVSICKHPCPTCGSVVWPDSSNPDQVYCSSRCAYRARMKITSHRSCAICGGDISGSPSRIRGGSVLRTPMLLSGIVSRYECGSLRRRYRALVGSTDRWRCNCFTACHGYTLPLPPPQFPYDCHTIDHNSSHK